jgi:hypothetical protein
MTNKWKSDGKLLNVSDNEMRVYESMYTVQRKVDTNPRFTPNKSNTKSRDDEVDILDNAVLDVSLEPEVDNNMVASIKMLREHMLGLPSRRQGDMSMIEESAIYEKGPFQIEGLNIDQALQTEVDQQVSTIADCRDENERYLPQGYHSQSYSSAPTSKREGRIGARKISSGQTSQEQTALEGPR